MVYERKSTIYNEGEESNFIYFIKEGEIKLIKSVPVKEKEKALDNNEKNLKKQK